jgi:hypothetical protein
MKTRTAVVAIAVGGAAVLGVLVAVPALAGPSNGAGPGFGPGMGMGTGQGMGAGYGMGAGQGMGTMDEAGGCLVGNAPKGTLTDGQKTTLAANAEEEKLAHDLYAEFATRYDATIFDHIAGAESMHLSAVRTLLDRYGIADPTAGLAQGSFATPAVQTTYDNLLAKGTTDERAALEVGVTVETDDIEQLRTALDGLTAPDVQNVYSRLLVMSDHHRTAFTAVLDR